MEENDGLLGQRLDTGTMTAPPPPPGDIAEIFEKFKESVFLDAGKDNAGGDLSAFL